jgi:hypothetical protein
LDALLRETDLWPITWQEALDSSFDQTINSTSWYIVQNIISNHEALHNALMNISCYNWSIICNRHGWSSYKEKNKTGVWHFCFFF